jgi:pyrroloquinoline quinone (PQQ) biosynthesis protein C
LSIASVADEAGILRSTIINRYPHLAQIIKDKSGFKSRNKSSDKKRISELEIKLANARSENVELKKQLAKAISLQANNIKI